jgi:hypothetical protein
MTVYSGLCIHIKRVMGLEPTISCLGSKRSTTELHPQARQIIPNIFLPFFYLTTTIPAEPGYIKGVGENIRPVGKSAYVLDQIMPLQPSPADWQHVGIAVPGLSFVLRLLA